MEAVQLYHKKVQLSDIVGINYSKLSLIEKLTLNKQTYAQMINHNY